MSCHCTATAPPLQGLPTERRQGASKAAAESAAALAAGQRRKVLVVFIGGVTYAEVGAGSILAVLFSIF